MSPSSFEVGNTVRCVHDEAKCGLGTACGYFGILNKLGTVIDITDHRRPMQRTSVGPHSIRVAFVGQDRPSVMPLDQIELVTDVDMINEWSSDLDRVNAHSARTNRYYDEAPDGSEQKQRAVETMKCLSKRRTFIESALNILC